MEETKPVQFSTDPQPPRTHSNKRKLSSVELRNSSYFKIRALVRQLRPQFIQVLQSPDFRNCKAAHELRIQMKLVMDSCKQMTMEIDPLEKFVLECQPSSGKSMPVKQSWDRQKDREVPELLRHNKPSEQPAEQKTHTNFNSQMKLDDRRTRKSYIVGGSVFGWNFITFGGSSPVYYGVTKESYRNTLNRKMS
ncbi:hypothetical protein P3X46_023788 [Hevea brasiliensis]|uniref:Uncharacterized protein n=1 Tax=Hevea brasiliensis TaxID=3981 RepID=A0ABQ9LD76_HEVBR|nr:uncharacterized protein LOC110658377 [Hevea brasiliensis]KAJ9164182.1 hypothetical protein P3X46_023788 [Hevea brasiliensis]